MLQGKNMWKCQVRLKQKGMKWDGIWIWRLGSENFLAERKSRGSVVKTFPTLNVTPNYYARTWGGKCNPEFPTIISGKYCGVIIVASGGIGSVRSRVRILTGLWCNVLGKDIQHLFPTGQLSAIYSDYVCLRKGTCLCPLRATSVVKSPKVKTTKI